MSFLYRAVVLSYVCLRDLGSWHTEWNTCEVKPSVAYLNTELSIQKFYSGFFFWQNKLGEGVSFSF